MSEANCKSYGSHNLSNTNNRTQNSNSRGNQTISSNMVRHFQVKGNADRIGEASQRDLPSKPTAA